MNTMIKALSGGFDDPVFQSQSTFRSVMDAMARPGTIAELAFPVNAPKPLSPAQGAIALTLCDQDTPVWLSPALVTSAVPAWLGFHAGADVTTERAAARFAFSDRASGLPPFSAFSSGSQDYPDRSATLVVEVESLQGGAPLELTGPGIAETASISPLGLPKPFIALWEENRNLFPRGIDLILTAGKRLVCLPRSIRIHTGRPA